MKSRPGRKAYWGIGISLVASMTISGASCASNVDPVTDESHSLNELSSDTDPCTQGMTTGEFSSDEGTITVPPAEFVGLFSYPGQLIGELCPLFEGESSRVDSVHVDYAYIQQSDRAPFESKMLDSRTIQVTIHAPYPENLGPISSSAAGGNYHVAKMEANATGDNSFVVTIHTKAAVKYLATNSPYNKAALSVVRINIAGL